MEEKKSIQVESIGSEKYNIYYIYAYTYTHIYACTHIYIVTITVEIKLGEEKNVTSEALKGKGRR